MMDDRLIVGLLVVGLLVIMVIGIIVQAFRNR